MNYSLKELIENRIKELGYIIVGEWENSLKRGWRIEAKAKTFGKDDYHYFYVYAEELLCEMLHDELGNDRMIKVHK